MADQHIDPERVQFDAFKALPRDTVIHMLNLVRFKAAATYPADHPLAADALTGAEAYAHYGADSGPVFHRVGGRIVWRGTMEAMVIGPDAEHWDAMFIAEYPTSAAFMEMVTDPVYRQAVIHRQAAVETSRLIRCNPKASRSGTGFG
ncbi:MAG TPA: DUF1330 domain-containing protein [Sphingopyxis sp.]|jgi:uncharacterized protein (DUF1330 family)|uniref:DUF1330 domain-containing protein n=1 Tax=Sphingopyxis sp. TaxID=1908224 RepID=UPI002E141281|nr:DUF1330 domain-containing protein [Sphingopyxis sp.]